MSKSINLTGMIGLIFLALQLTPHHTPAFQPGPQPLLAEGAARGWAGVPALSADGRMLAFIATMPDVVPEDRNMLADVFVQDRQTGNSTLASQSSDGVQANGWSYRISLSADGRTLAFTSIADNLVAGDRNGVADIFVHDLLTRETTLVSVGAGGEPSNGWSDWPAVSGDGRFVAFSSAGNNLVWDDTNGAIDVFVHDRLTRQTQRVSVSTAGAEGNAASGWATSISSDGRWIAFASEADNLAAGDQNLSQDVYLHNRVTGTTLRAPMHWEPSEDYLGSDWPALSNTGKYLVFTAQRRLGSDEGEGREDSLLVYMPASGALREISHTTYLASAGGGDLRGTVSGESLIYVGRKNAETAEPDWGISIIDLRTGESPQWVTAHGLGTGLTLLPEKPALAEEAQILAYTAADGGSTLSGPGEGAIYVEDPSGAPATYHVSGRVTDSYGTPIRSATITLNTGAATATDREGIFFFSSLPAGLFKLTIQKEGYLFSPEEIVLNVDGDVKDIQLVARSDDLLDEARKDIGMPYSFHRGCESELDGCEGPYHGFYSGYCTDLILDAYRWGVDFNLQFALERDALAHPGHFYRWRNARNAHDMWRYFHYTGQMLANDQPYQPGDILFFDWDDDTVIDHVSLLSEVDTRGRPIRMIDATGKIAYNPSGLAAELDWVIFHQGTIRGHARWLGSYGAIRPATPPGLQVLQIAVDSQSVTPRLFDSNGNALPGATNGSANTIPGGKLYTQGLGSVISVVSPPAGEGTYLLELEGLSDQGYNLQIQTLTGGRITDYVAQVRQALAAGEVRLIGVKLTEEDGDLHIQLIPLR